MDHLKRVLEFLNITKKKRLDVFQVVCVYLPPSACIRPEYRPSSHILHWAGRW